MNLSSILQPLIGKVITYCNDDSGDGITGKLISVGSDHFLSEEGAAIYIIPFISVMWIEMPSEK